MAGLFSSGEQDLLGNIVQNRQAANAALGSNYGRYGGIVQAAAGLTDVQADSMFGGQKGAADPRMQQLQGAKAIFAKVSKEMVDVSSPAFYERLAKEFSAAGFPEQAQKAADKAMELKPKAGDGASDLLKGGKYTPESVSVYMKSNNPSDLVLAEKPKAATEIEKIMDAAGITNEKERQGIANKYLMSKLQADKGDQTAKAALDLLSKQLDVKIQEQKVAKTEKEAAEAEKAGERKIKADAYKTASIVNTINSALEQVSGSTAGVGGTLLSRLPGTSATDLQANLETIQANLGFDQLQAMRDASPTGGALGQVSERELLALQSTVASLRQDQSPAQLRANIEKVKKHYQNWLSTLSGVNPDEKKKGTGVDDSALINKYLKGK